MTNLPQQSQRPSQKSQSRELRKVTAERDRARGSLRRLKERKKERKLRRQRQTLGQQVVSLTIKHTQAVIDGEV